MGFETPKVKDAKEQNNSEIYLKEATDIAQRISRSWQKLKGQKGLSRQLEEILEMNKPPKTGIQLWFEDQVKFINQSAGDENSKSRMTYRLKEDLERIEGEVNELIS
jgi:hypothetical protein